MMRSIEQEMLKAMNRFKQESKAQTWRKDNTKIRSDTVGHISVYLHDNRIAYTAAFTKKLTVDINTLREWPTMTTRSRLRALGFDLCSIKGELHLDNVSIYASQNCAQK